MSSSEQSRQAWARWMAEHAAEPTPELIRAAFEAGWGARTDLYNTAADAEMPCWEEPDDDAMEHATNVAQEQAEAVLGGSPWVSGSNTMSLAVAMTEEGPALSLQVTLPEAVPQGGQLALPVFMNRESILSLGLLLTLLAPAAPSGHAPPREDMN